MTESTLALKFRPIKIANGGRGSLLYRVNRANQLAAGKKRRRTHEKAAVMQENYVERDENSSHLHRTDEREGGVVG